MSLAVPSVETDVSLGIEKPQTNEIFNVLTIDVEEYFHPTEVQNSVSANGWHTYPSRIESEVFDILELLHEKRVRATFFILGWVAEHHKAVVQAIVDGGHEI